MLNMKRFPPPFLSQSWWGVLDLEPKTKQRIEITMRSSGSIKVGAKRTYSVDVRNAVKLICGK